MKKRVIALMLALAMTIPMGLAACNKTPENDEGDKPNQGVTDGNNTNNGDNGNNSNNGDNTNNGDNKGENVNKPDDTQNPVEDAEDWYTDYGTVDNEEYNKNLYFLNELKFEVADPSVIYIDHGEEVGYFYAYGTSDMVGGHGIQCWRSKDLTNWEYKSVAYRPDFGNTWASRNHWAPEVLFDEDSDEYIMVYNADYADGDIYQTNWATKGDQSKAMTIVSSKNPYGPFEPIEDKFATKPAYDFSPRNDLIPKALQRSNTIDGHFYIDPVSGKKYLYYSGYGHDGLSADSWHAQTLFGVEMKTWTEPDYSTVVELTKNSRTTVDAPTYDIIEGSGEYSNTVNEGAFMWYKDGTYYLTYSVYGFTESQYQVRQAISDSPLGPFRKIQPNDGGQIIVTDPAWDTITSAGHHCFIPCGDKLMIAYHTFLNRNDIGNGRALAVDTISWVKNAKGETLMHANGPTYSYQPLPEEISGYKNLAPLATITANNTADGSDVKYLNDDTLKIHSYDPVQEFTTKGGKTEITLDFGKFVKARSILIYNASDYDRAFTEISSIKLRCKGKGDTTVEKTIKEVPFDFSWHSDEWSVIYPGANSIVEFDELPVDRITITINAGAEDIISINEIVVLGREVKNAAALTQALESYSYTSPEEVSFIPVYESNMFGSAGDGYFKSAYGFDLSHDDGTENAYVEKTWAGNLQNLYFKDVESTVFYVEVELSVGTHTKTYAGDPYPKAGIVMRSRNNYFVSFNIDYTSSFTGTNVGFVQSKSDGSDYDWDHYTTFPGNGIKYTGDNYTKLGVARIGKDIYLFADDQLIEHYDTLRGFTGSNNTACAIALVTFNCYTKFSNYSVTTVQDEVEQKISALTGENS